MLQCGEEKADHTDGSEIYRVWKSNYCLLEQAKIFLLGKEKIKLKWSWDGPKGRRNFYYKEVESIRPVIEWNFKWYNHWIN